jgi:hypothetical protein
MKLPYFASSPIYKTRSEIELLHKNDEAELIKEGAWLHYIYDKTLEERISALRTIVRSKYIQAFCGRMNHSKVGLSYKELKDYYLSKNPTRFQQEEINGI